MTEPTKRQKRLEKYLEFAFIFLLGGISGAVALGVYALADLVF